MKTNLFATLFLAVLCGILLSPAAEARPFRIPPLPLPLPPIPVPELPDPIQIPDPLPPIWIPEPIPVPPVD